MQQTLPVTLERLLAATERAAPAQGSVAAIGRDPDSGWGFYAVIIDGEPVYCQLYPNVPLAVWEQAKAEVERGCATCH